MLWIGTVIEPLANFGLGLLDLLDDKWIFLVLSYIFRYIKLPHTIYFIFANFDQKMRRWSLCDSNLDCCHCHFDESVS